MLLVWSRRTSSKRKKFKGFGYIKSQIQAYIAEILAFLVFLCLQPYLQTYLDGPHKEDLAKKLKLQSETNNVYQKDFYNQHGAYITDNDIAFQTNVQSCDISPKDGTIPRHSKIHRKRPSIIFDALFLVCSAAENGWNRQTMRRMYGSYNNTRPYRIKIVFLVGLSVNDSVQTALRKEILTTGDILQGNFVDHYFNLTYKTIMGYRWAQVRCRDVTLVLKIDDDVYVDIFKFFAYFLPIIPIRQRRIYGYLNNQPLVHRQGKYQVEEEEFANKRYPEFCSGFFVMPTRDVVDRIYEVAKTVRYFRLEDVFTYALVREAMVDVQLVHLDVITHEWFKYKDCVDTYKYRCKYLAAELFPDQIMEYYNRTLEHRRYLGLLPQSTDYRD